jgi:hypothetical protein
VAGTALLPSRQPPQHLHASTQLRRLSSSERLLRDNAAELRDHSVRQHKKQNPPRTLGMPHSSSV